MAAYKTSAGSTVSFTLQVTPADVEKAKNSVIQRYKNTAQIKGFRPGKVPTAKIMEMLSEAQLKAESAEQAITKAYQSFLKEHNLHPIEEPKMEVKEKDKDGSPTSFDMTIVVYPTAEVGDYKKIMPKAVTVEVDEKEVNEYIESAMKAQGIGKEVKRKAKKGDTAIVSFAGRKEKGGDIIPNTDAKETVHLVGSGQYLKDLEAAFIGMKAGEKKEGIEVKFPEDYHAPDFKGQTILFDVEMHAVKDASAKDITEEQIKTLIGQDETKEKFFERTATILKSKHQTEAEKAAVQAFETAVVKQMKIDLPAKWLEQETQKRIAQVKLSPQFQQDPKAYWKTAGTTEKKFEKEAAEKAELGLKTYLGLQEIIKLEGITLSEDEQKQVVEITKKRLPKNTSIDSSRGQAMLEQNKFETRLNKFFTTCFQ